MGTGHGALGTGQTGNLLDPGGAAPDIYMSAVLRSPTAYRRESTRLCFRLLARAQCPEPV